jgi:hypothetical protein
MAGRISPYHSLISAVQPPTVAEFTLPPPAMDKLHSELPMEFRQQRYLISSNALAALLEKAFFHIHNNYPIFHRPTTQIESFPTYLILALASFGALLADDSDTQHFGLSLHNYVRDSIFSVHPSFVELT